MKLIWHIFKKDVRYLRLEIALLLGLSVFIGWMDSRGLSAGVLADILEPFTVAAAGYAIARLIHAEALPGENQFWITRPYSWRTLLAAKLLFIFVFVSLPVLFVQSVILNGAGFPIASTIPGSLWTQVLLAFAVLLPLTALAALTTGMVQFIGTGLSIGAFAYVAMLFDSWPRISTPAPIEWLRYGIVLVTLAAIAPLILYLQYRYRRTQFSRTLALSMALCGASLFFNLPWRTLFPLQSRLSRQSFDAHVIWTQDPTCYHCLGTSRTRARGRIELSTQELHVDLPLAITNLPSGTYPQIEGFGLRLEAPDGRSSELGTARLAIAAPPERNLTRFKLQGSTQLDRRFFNAERNRPLTLRAAFYITVFGHTRDKTIVLRRAPQDVMDGLQCYAGLFNQLECQSAFRWPARIVSQKGAGEGRTTLTRLISYSPFPAALQLDPIVHKGTDYYSREPLPLERPVTIEVEEPLAYFRRDLEIAGLRLGAN